MTVFDCSQKSSTEICQSQSTASEHSSGDIVRFKIDFIRPPNVVGIGLRFYTGYIFFLSFLFYQQFPRSSLNGTQPNFPAHMFGSEPDSKMHVQNFTLLQKIGCSKTVFDVIQLLRNITLNVTANVVGMKHDVNS